MTASASERVLDGVRVLVVEDDFLSARLVTLLLDQAGAEVRIAPTAEEALILMESFQPSLMVLDFVLPRMSGLQLMQHMRADAVLSKIVVIAVTSMNGGETQRVAEQAGCAAYIHKPINIETFAQSIAEHLEVES